MQQKSDRAEETRMLLEAEAKNKKQKGDETLFCSARPRGGYQLRFAWRVQERYRTLAAAQSELSRLLQNNLHRIRKDGQSS